jgi:hypothetical protein
LPGLPSRTAIFRAIQPGTRRCRSQREWLQAALTAIDAEPWYTNRRAHYAAVARCLMRHMDWRARTARPGHDRLAAAGGMSPDTVARAVAWMHHKGLLGVVSPGSTPLLRPHVLHSGEGNHAVVYVLTVPRQRKPRLPAPDAGQEKIADLSRPRSGLDIALRAREANSKARPGKARASRGQPVLPRVGTADLNACPKTRSNRLEAAQAMQDRCPSLRRMSDRQLRHLARPFTDDGWTPADVLYALDHEPGGRQHSYTTAVRSPAAWAASRLRLWFNPATGAPLPSPSQLAAERRRSLAAEQRARREQLAAARAQAGDYPAQASRARAMLEEALAAKGRGTAAALLRSSRVAQTPGPGPGTPRSG